MARVTLNPAIHSISGALGSYVYRHLSDDRVFLVRISLPKPDFKPSPAQAAQRQRFREAAALYQDLLADPGTRAAYERILAFRGPLARLRALIIGDIMRPPQITRLDLSDYNPLSGGCIRIRAEDSVAVSRLDLAIYDLTTALDLETAELVPDKDPLTPALNWTYKARACLPAGHAAEVRVTAHDLAGNATTATYLIPSR